MPFTHFFNLSTWLYIFRYFLVEVPTNGDINRSSSFICVHKSHKGVRIVIGSHDLRSHIDTVHTSGQEVSKAKAVPKVKAALKAKSAPTAASSVPRPAGVSSSPSVSSLTAVLSSSSVSNSLASDLAALHPLKNGSISSVCASGAAKPPPTVAPVTLIPKLKFLRTAEQVHDALGSENILKGESGSCSFVSIAARSDRLIAIALPSFTYVVDLKGVGTTGDSLLLPLLCNLQVLKVTYDLYAISHFLNCIEGSITPVLDIQLVAEEMMKLPFDSSLYDCVTAFEPSLGTEQRKKSYAALLQEDAALTISSANSVASEAIWISQAYRKRSPSFFQKKWNLAWC